MKYQSEIIKEIIDTGGHKKSSLHYESECIESWVDENKGSYPKLCDYQSEWLNYINENPLGEFPYETLVDVTKATINNVVPYAYKSAILTGQTLVNLAQSTNPTNLNGEYVFRDNLEILNFGCNMIKPSTTYTIISNIIENSANFLKLEWNTILDECAFKEIIRSDGSLGIRKFKVTSKDDLSNASKSIRFIPNNKQENGTLTITFILLEGDYTNVDIPYFEGMQSVKMPVLTTSNEDGTKTNILTVNEDVELRGIGDVKDELDCLTGEVTQRIGEVVLDGSGRYNIGGGSNDNYLEFIYSVNPNSKRASVLCDKVFTPSGGHQNNVEYIRATESGIIGYILKSRLSTPDIEGLKAWLSSNNVTVQYQLATESVKTVDLTVVNQDGENVSLKPIEGTMHLSTSSETINPLFSGEIPVEAITQNLASFIELEMGNNNE